MTMLKSTPSSRRETQFDSFFAQYTALKSTPSSRRETAKSAQKVG